MGTSSAISRCLPSRLAICYRIVPDRAHINAGAASINGALSRVPSSDDRPQPSSPHSSHGPTAVVEPTEGLASTAGTGSALADRPEPAGGRESHSLEFESDPGVVAKADEDLERLEQLAELNLHLHFEANILAQVRLAIFLCQASSGIRSYYIPNPPFFF